SRTREPALRSRTSSRRKSQARSTEPGDCRWPWVPTKGEPSSSNELLADLELMLRLPGHTVRLGTANDQYVRDIRIPRRRGAQVSDSLARRTVYGLLVQPVIGHMSDHTWNRLGRRRPYFLVGALLASAALVAMPNVSALWMAAGLLWVMDASINI